MYANGSVVWSGVADFDLDRDERVVLLGTNQHLERQSDTGWDLLATQVSRFAWRARDNALLWLRGESIYTDGTISWSGVADFALDQFQRVLILGTNHHLERQTGSGWELIDTDVESFYLNPDGTVGINSELQPASLPVNGDGRWGVVFRDNNVVFNPRVWAPNGFNYTDVDQENSNICTIASTLASAASQGYDLGSRITYLGSFNYRVFLYEGGWQTVHFDGTVFDSDLRPTTVSETYQIQSGGLVDKTQIVTYWPLLFARAYLQSKGVNWSQPATTWPGGLPRASWNSSKNALFAIAGGEKNNWDLSESVAMQHMLWDLRNGSLVIVDTYQFRFGGDGRGLFAGFSKAFRDGHAWAVLDLFQEGGTWKVRLFNPWNVSDGDFTNPDNGRTEYVYGNELILTWKQFKAGFITYTSVTRAGTAHRG